MTVDLARFADRVRAGGLALLPSAAAETGAAAWHVTFVGTDVSASLDVRVDGSSSPAAAPASGPRIYSPPASSSARANTFTVSPGPGPTRSPAVAQPSAAATTGVGSLPNTNANTSTNATRVAPIARVAREGYRYGVIFFLPLALLVFAGYFASALTRDPEPRSS